MVMSKEEKTDNLATALQECRREPELTLKEVAEIVAFEIEDLTEFLKEYKKELIKV